jgi:hypothetical protein
MYSATTGVSRNNIVANINNLGEMVSPWCCLYSNMGSKEIKVSNVKNSNRVIVFAQKNFSIRGVYMGGSFSSRNFLMMMMMTMKSEKVMFLLGKIFH